MKQSTDQLASDIIRFVLDECNTDLPKEQKEKMKSHVSRFITWHIDDALKQVKLINTISQDVNERVQRICYLENNFGIPKTHLI